MFANKAFNIALLISLTWHLMCMFTVNIIISPGKYRTRELTSVSFLGPILEKTALDIILANKPIGITTRYQRNLKDEYIFPEEKKPFPENSVKDHITARVEDKMNMAFAKVSEEEKEVPEIATKATGRGTYFKNSEQVSGAASIREVLYKPIRPKLPAWIIARSPFKMELEFIVSPQGEVKKIVPVVSSGDAEIDLLGIRYLRNWRFVPLLQASSKEQNGRIKLIFDK